MLQDLLLLQQKATKEIDLANNLADLDSIRVHYLGKKGCLTELLKQIGKLPNYEKASAGKTVNEVKHTISELIEEKKVKIKDIELTQKINTDQIDVTLPGRNFATGTIHPITQVKNRINDYFISLGFGIVTGPEIENEFYNFEALNIPKYHPARAMQDTFYFGNDKLLRTHTSPVQIHIMQHRQPPFRLIAPGRVYRRDLDATHTPMFHQVEGLCIDKEVTLSGLKGIIQNFFNYFFNQEIPLRFRASYFPFTEPSAEVDIICNKCTGKGCKLCKFSGWLEVLGCGMVHPNVLSKVGITAEYQGWAFGMGIDRLTMLYFGIDDLRILFENDLMLLKQF